MLEKIAYIDGDMSKEHKNQVKDMLMAKTGTFMSNKL